jgi:parvulin-like peptidyl-prolyl isomerase
MTRRDRDRDRERDKQDEPKSTRTRRRALQRAAERRERAQRSGVTDTEGLNRRLIIGSVIVIVLAAIGFIAFGWYQTQIKPLGKTVLRVGDIEYSLGHLENRMRLERKENQAFTETSQNLLQLPDIMIDRLEAEATLIEGLKELKLEVTDEDLAAEIRSRGGLAEDVEANVYADEVRKQVNDSGLNRGEYELMLRADIAERKARDYFLFLGPTEEPQVRANVMLFDDQELAQQALQRLEAGENFVAVAEEISLSPQSVGVDWVPRGSGRLSDEVEEFLFSAEEGEHSELIEAFSFFYIAELLERDETRPLDDSQRQSVASRELDEWVAGLRESFVEAGTTERNFSQDDAIKALDDII